MTGFLDNVSVGDVLLLLLILLAIICAVIFIARR